MEENLRKSFEMIFCLCGVLSGVVSICDTKTDHKGAYVLAYAGFSLFSPFLMLNRTNNTAAGAVTGHFSLPNHPNLPEDKQLRTGGTPESIQIGSKASLLQVEAPNERRLPGDRSRLQNKNELELCVPGVFGAAQE